MAKKQSPPATIGEYLARLPKDQRDALQKLRTQIARAAPRAEETISYQVPTFKLDGRGLVGFGAAAGHCSLFLMSETAIAPHRGDLEGYALGKGTVRFAADEPLPAALVTRLVKTRLAELRASKPAPKK